MATAIRVVLQSRSAHWAAVATVAMCAFATLTGPRAIEIDLSPQFPPTKLVMVELCVILAATLLAIITRPRFWEWDRAASTPRPRVDPPQNPPESGVLQRISGAAGTGPVP